MRKLLAGILVVTAAALFWGWDSAQADHPEELETTLHPGWNMVGWVEEAAPVRQIFDELSRVIEITAWDAGEQRWVSASPEGGELETVEPGMGLWLRLGGDAPLRWLRSRGEYSNSTMLRPGMNLVAWQALDAVPAAVGLRQIRNSAVMAGAWDAATQEWRLAAVPLAFSYWSLSEFNHGDGLWIRASEEVTWRQLTGESPPVTFVGDVSEQQRAETLAELETYRETFAATFGGLASGAQVVVFSDVEANQAWSEEVWGSGRSREACGSARGWEAYYTISCGKSVLAHEYFHVLQHAAERLGRLALPPLWIEEGGATYAQMLASSVVEGRDFSKLIEASWHGSQADGRDLSTTTDTYDYHQYQTGAAAIHLLMQTNGADELLQYERRLSSAPPGVHYRAYGGDPYSRAVFEEQFGISIPVLEELMKSASPGFEQPQAQAVALQTQELPLRLQLEILSPDGSRYNSAATMYLTAADNGSQFAELAIAGSLSIPVEPGRYEVQAIELGGGCHVGFDAPEIVVEDRFEDLHAILRLKATGCNAVVSGTVLGRDGRPLQPRSQRVWVELFPESAEDFHWSRATQVEPDEHGRFQVSVAVDRYSVAVSPIESGGALFGWVTNDGFSPNRANRAILDLTTDLEQMVTIRLPISRAVRISGVVYDGNGHPAENLTVFAEGSGGGLLRPRGYGMSRGWIGWRQRTDSRGSFDLPFAGEDAVVVIFSEEDCHLGWFGPDGFTTDLSEISFWETQDRDIRDLRIELPQTACQ